MCRYDAKPVRASYIVLETASEVAVFIVPTLQNRGLKPRELKAFPKAIHHCGEEPGSEHRALTYCMPPVTTVSLWASETRQAMHGGEDGGEVPAAHRTGDKGEGTPLWSPPSHISEDPGCRQPPAWCPGHPPLRCILLISHLPHAGNSPSTWAAAVLGQNISLGVSLFSGTFRPPNSNVVGPKTQ